MKPKTEVPARTRELIERMSQLVPEFGSYQSTDSRRDDDGRFRVELCERLDIATVQLEDILLEMSEEGWVPGMESIDQVIRDLDSMRERVTSGHDQPPEVSLAMDGDVTVQRLLERDLALLVEMDSLQEHLTEVSKIPVSGRRLQQMLGELTTAVFGIEEAILARESLALPLCFGEPPRLAA